MTEAAARAFGFTLYYRPVGPELVGPEGPDDRPVDRLPSCAFPTLASEPEREAELLKEAQRLEAQGYRVERVVRESFCGRCEGVGDIPVRPKGWRKKSAPPWYLMKRIACPACGGGGAEHIVQGVQDLPGGAR